MKLKYLSLNIYSLEIYQRTYLKRITFKSFFLLFKTVLTLKIFTKNLPIKLYF